MIEISNYEKYLKKKEEESEKELLILLFLLFNQLKILLKKSLENKGLGNNLNAKNINAITKSWDMNYSQRLVGVIKGVVLDANIYTQKLLNNKIENKLLNNKIENKLLINKLVKSNNLLLDEIITDLKNEFITFGIINNINKQQDKQVEFYLKKLEHKLIDKIKKYVFYTVNMAVRSLLFENAKQKGYNAYIWGTQEDNRVRLTHKKMNKKVVLIDQAPKTTDYKHVGEDYGCRCYAKSFLYI